MKFYYTLILLFTASFSFADCASSGMNYWPMSKEINQNPIIIIEGYGMDQAIIKGLNKRYPVYLKNGDERVKLIVKELNAGEFELTQAVLVPESNLIAGQEYELQISNIKGMEISVSRWNPETSKHELVKWIANDINDQTKPTWVKRPIEKDKSIEFFGCGPAKSVNFSFEVKESSEFLIRTTVKSVDSKEATTYYLQVSNLSEISIGHGMCSGAFTFEGGTQFIVSFDIVDASGNVTPWIGKNMTFTKPLSADY